MKLNLPSIHRRVSAKLPGEVAVLHAALDMRQMEMVLAFALACKSESAVIVKSVHDAQYCLTKWAEKAGVKFGKQSVGKSRWISIGSSAVWLVPEGEVIPSRGLGFIGVIGAEGITDNPIVWVRPKMREGASLVVCGQMPMANTWWDTFLDQTHDRVELPADLIVAQFPDQRHEVDPSSPGYPRSMMLEDVSLAVPPWFTFSRRRLKVRTEKRYEQMSPAQRVEVDQQPGADRPIVSLELHSIQRRYFAMKELGRRRGFSRFVTVKYRRAGITTSEEGYAYRRCCEYAGAQAMFLADTEPKTKKLFGIARGYYDLDPEQPALKAAPSMTSMDFANGSQFFCATAGGTGARGDGVSIVHWTEVPFAFKGPQAISKADHLLSALLGACPNGELTLEGTPRGRELLYEKYMEAKRAMRGEDLNGRYWPIFLRWFDDPRNRVDPSGFDSEEIHDTLSTKEKKLRAMHGLDLSQIAFRRDVEKEHGRLFQQEYPEDDETCFFSAGTGYFDREYLIGMMDSMDEFKGEKIPGIQAWLKTWEKPIDGHRYVIGVDTSEGIMGCDPNGLGVLDVTDGLVPVACVHGHMKPEQLAVQVKIMSELYCQGRQRALIGVERQNHGHAVLLQLKNLGIERAHDDGGSLYHYAKGRSGWNTSSATRPVMLHGLDAAISDGSFVPPDRDCLRELLSFILGERGKFEAAPGMHDDRIFKWGIAIQMAGVPRRSGVSLSFSRM